MLNYERYLSTLSFNIIQPHHEPGPDGIYPLPRAGGTRAKLLQISEPPFDVINTHLPDIEHNRQAALEELCAIPRMSTLALARLYRVSGSKSTYLT